MDKKYILFIDSGIGGLSILDYLNRRSPNLNVIYYADVEHFPYGGKDEKTLGGYLLDIYHFAASQYQIAMVVIACNTASVAALSFLREHVSIPVVGTVPAVKLAANLTKNERIGIIATETTVKLSYLQNLIDNYAADKEVFIKAAPDLVNVIEHCEGDAAIKNVVAKELASFDGTFIDTLVLGCTHFSFAEKQITEYFDSMVLLVDSRDGITKRILSLLTEDMYDLSPRKILYTSDRKSIDTYLHFNSILHIFTEIYSKDAEWKKVSFSGV